MAHDLFLKVCISRLEILSNSFTELKRVCAVSSIALIFCLVFSESLSSFFVLLIKEIKSTHRLFYFI